MPKLLITGVSSFMGHHLAYDLSNDYEVVGTLSKHPRDYTDIQRSRIENLESKISLEQLDLLRPGDLSKMIGKCCPDYIIHHAGYATNYGGFEYNYPLSLEVNIRPLPELFQAAKDNDVKGVVVSGTSMEYSDGSEVHREEEACIPSTPYGLSKFVETLRSIQLAKHHDVALRVARLFNPFGIYESEKKLLPYVLDCLSKKQKVELSACEQIRNFDLAENVVKIYAKLLVDCDKGGQEIYNATTIGGVSLKELLMMFCEALERDPELLCFGVKPMRAGEAAILDADLSKTNQLMGNQSSSLKSSIEKFVEQWKTL